MNETLAHGPRRLADGQIEFRLWAPDCRQVQLLRENAAPQAMQRNEQGFFTCTARCETGSAYRFQVSQDLSVPDPASRAQRDGVHGWSLVADNQYTWQETGWRGRPWTEMVIYELHAGLCGGYGGVQAQLGRLASLGVSAIELMPIGEFTGARNWGYDGVLPYAPHAAYGSPDELRRLVDAAHAQGISVLLDVVYNHFGPDGNYLNSYASRFFRQDKPTPWGPAIDFREPAVREYFIGNALYWLQEFRIDGLRFDAVHAIDDEDFLREMAQRLRAAIGSERHLHLVLENEHNQAGLLEGAYDAQWNDDGHNVLHHLLTGEDEAYYGSYKDRPTEKLARCLGEGFIYQGEMPPGAEQPRGEPSGHLPPTKFVLFLQNHDQVGNRALGERLCQMIDEERLRAAALLLLLSPQIPLLFMGEEWGSTRPFQFFTSFGPDLGKLVREGRRREFAKFSTFADPQKRESIPDPNELATFVNSRPDFDGPHTPAQQQWLNYTRRLLELRRTQLMPQLGSAHALGAQVIADKAVQASWRLETSRLHIAINLSDAAVALSLPGECLAESREGAHDGRQLALRAAIALLEPAA